MKTTQEAQEEVSGPEERANVKRERMKGAQECERKGEGVEERRAA
jgi:hypothetical protein